MKRITVNYEMPEIEIDGKKYRCMISMMELRAAAAEFMQAMYSAHVNNDEEIRAAIQVGCDMVDKALGKGSMLRIASGEAVSLPKVTMVINTILTAVNNAYAQYVKQTYPGVRR